MRLGLPEGVIKAGGKISGFVYFQNASTRGTSLNLVWHANNPRGQSIANVTVPFVVVQR